MTLNYDAGQNGNYECPDNGWIAAGSSRSSSVHSLAGAWLRSRAVGCTGLRPRFPVTPFSQGSNLAPTSETYGLGFGVHVLIGLLSRFNPQTATIANVKSGTGLTCFFDHFLGVDGYPNSNSAAWPLNNAFAMWDLIDADTSDADDGVSDTFDWTLQALVLALEDNAWNTGGSSGQNRYFEEFNYSTSSSPAFCGDNEGCPNGQACMGPPNQQQCRSGDTSGGNIGDLRHQLEALQATYSWPGNIADTLKSSLCFIGNPDNAYPFSGSDRND